MEFRSCQSCGEYRYIKDNGVCPTCHVNYDIKHKVLKGNGEFVNNKQSRRLLEQLSSKSPKSIIPPRIPHNHTIDIIGDDGRFTICLDHIQSTIGIYSDGTYKIESLSEEAFKKSNSFVHKLLASYNIYVRDQLKLRHNRTTISIDDISKNTVQNLVCNNTEYKKTNNYIEKHLSKKPNCKGKAMIYENGKIVIVGDNNKIVKDLINTVISDIQATKSKS